MDLNDTADIANQLLVLESDLSIRVSNIGFSSPVAYIYNPIEYAYDVHANYVKKYCSSKKKILFLGMNPGPWGMSQTGVPFGTIKIVLDWLRLGGEIQKPANEHPDRRVTGFDCTRTEISGDRFWKLFKRLCEQPEKFFQYAFLRNYCPIALMRDTGKNITPPELKGLQGKRRELLEAECDEALKNVIQLLNIEKIVALGRYAEKKAKEVIQKAGLNTEVYYLKHPSPQIPGNTNWDDEAERTLTDYGLINYFSS